MDLGLSGKGVIVLASSRGLGRAVAHAFAAEGARVMIGSRDGDRLARTAEEIAAATGAEVLPWPCDVTSPGQIGDLVSAAAEALGGVDVLVNNSGGPRAGTFEELEEQSWRDAFELTLMSFVRAIRAVLPDMRARGGGRIVNMASTSTREPIDGLLLSNVFRAGVGGLTKTLASELAPDGVLVNVVAPGRIATDRLRELDEIVAEKRGTTADDVRRAMESRIPLGRHGTPEELARAVVWLGSWANTYVTGQLLCVDGGLVKSL